MDRVNPGQMFLIEITPRTEDKQHGRDLNDEIQHMSLEHFNDV